MWMLPIKATEMDRASDTTDSGISIRPLGGAGGGESWPLPVVGGMEERADKAAPARFRCEWAWAIKNETEETWITAWCFSPEAHDVVSRFQTAWAHKDAQDIIAWIFHPAR